MTQIARPTGPRLYQIDAVGEVDPELGELLAKTVVGEGGPLNIFRTLAHHPKLMKRFNVLGGAFLANGVLPARKRESVSDTTWAALRTRWNDTELVELIALAGFYRMVSGFLNTMGVQLDDGIPGWPNTPGGAG